MDLAELYVVAEEAGLKPRYDFAAVSKLSGDEKPRGGSTPVREMMDHLSRYAVLEERRSKSKGN